MAARWTTARPVCCGPARGHSVEALHWLPLLSNWPGSDALRLGAAIAAFGPTLSSLRCLLRLSRRIAAPCRMQAAVSSSHAAMKAQIHVLGDAGYVWDAQGECTTWGRPACVLLRRLQHA